MAVRDTQTVVEVLLVGTPNLRSTQTVVEVLLVGTPNLRSTQTVVEVLRTPGSGLEVSASTALTLAPASSAVTWHVYTVSASTALTLSPTASQSALHVYTVSASTALALHSATEVAVPGPRAVSAATTLTLSCPATVPAVVLTPTTWYRLDETAGTTAFDSGSGGLGLAHVGPRPCTYVGSVTPTTDGPYGSPATEFGAGGYAESNSPVLGISNVTGFGGDLGVWFKLSAFPTGPTGLAMIAGWVSGSVYALGIMVDAAGLLTASTYGYSSLHPVTPEPHSFTFGTVTPGDWHYAVLSLTPNSGAYGTASLYLDGVLMGSGQVTETGGSGYNFFIAGVPSSVSTNYGQFLGSVQDVTIHTVTAPTEAAVWAAWKAKNHAAYSASATTSFTASAAGFHGLSYLVSAATAFTLAGPSSAFPAHTYLVSASTALTLRPSASERTTHVYFVSASTAAVLGSAALSPSPWSVSAATRVYLNGLGRGVDSILFVSASTSLMLGQSNSFTCPGPRAVSAATAFTLGQASVIACPGPRAVSASTALTLSGPADRTANRLWSVSAASGLGLSASAAASWRGLIHVSAATGVTFSGPATSSRLAALRVGATTALNLSARGAESADFRPAAASSVSLAGAGRQCRDLYASATTSLVAGAGPAKNNFRRVSAASLWSLSVTAGASVGGTAAASGLIFTDLAQATVWLPWLTAALARPAQGNLPHS